MRKRNRVALVLAGMAVWMGLCPGCMAQDGAGLACVMAADHDPKAQGYLEADFEDDYQPFTMRSGKEIGLTTEGSDPNHVLLIAGRDATWDGPSVDVTDWLQPSKEYTFCAYVKQKENMDHKVNLSIEVQRDGEVSYLGLKDGIVLPSSVWKKIKINFTAPKAGADCLKIYMQSGEEATFDFMMDEISIKPSEGGSRYDAAMAAYSLKDTYKDYFRVGMSFLIDEFQNENFRKMMQYQFNSGTYGNEFKPDYMLDQEASKASADGSPEIRYDRIDEFLTLARDNQTPIRGHVLVWYSQTPDWFFKEGYDENGAFVDHATMSFRMEQYIRKMLEYTRTNYPGVIYAWDVVNEAADDGGGYRKSNNNWWTVMGESYIEEAFRYARKYASPEIRLFYNDYNEYLPAKRETIYGWLVDLQGKGLIDGMGMQSHVDLKDTAVEDYLETAALYGSTGLDLQVTELDIHNPDNGVAGSMKLADKYAAIFGGLCDLKRSGKANVTAVTIWGFSDDITWLNDNRGQKSYPLLFDEDGKPKEAFRAVIDVVVPGVREQYEKKW